MIEDPPTTRILLANRVSFALLDYIGAACTRLQVENAHDVRIKSHLYVIGGMDWKMQVQARYGY